jgi:hypothetical protein
LQDPGARKSTVRWLGGLGMTSSRPKLLPSAKAIYHTWTLLKGIAMSKLLGIGTQVTFGNGQSNLVQAIRESTQESANQAGERIVEKDLNIQPTITVRPTGCGKPECYLNRLGHPCASRSA